MPDIVFNSLTSSEVELIRRSRRFKLTRPTNYSRCRNTNLIRSSSRLFWAVPVLQIKKKKKKRLNFSLKMFFRFLFPPLRPLPFSGEFSPNSPSFSLTFIRSRKLVESNKILNDSLKALRKDNFVICFLQRANLFLELFTSVNSEFLI